MTSPSDPVLVAARRVVTQAKSAGSAAELEQAVRDCYPLTRAASDEQKQAVLDTLAPALSVPDLERMVLVGYLCGALIEDGISGSTVEAPLIARYLELSRLAREFYEAAEHAGEDAAAQRLPQARAAHELLARSAAPCISLLCAAASARRLAAPLVDVLLPLSRKLASARELCDLALVLDDAPFVALEPSTRRGIRGRMTGIADNAQLHTLLMHAFPRAEDAGPRVSERAVQNARGRGPQNLREVVTGAFTLYAWQGLRADHSLSAEDAHVLWNEARPAHIPEFEGVRVILLGPPRYERTWAAQREFARLSADLSVDETLAPSAVASWLERLSRAAS